MATIKPFRAVRPTAALASQVAALPYDVMNEAEARDICSKNPLSFLHIDRSEVDLPQGIDPTDPLIYETAASTMYRWIAEDVFVQDETPCFYIYRLIRNGQSQTGLVCCTAASEYESGIIKKHELTRAEKEADRIRHVDTCNAQTGPIFMAYQDKSIADFCHAWCDSHPAEVDFVADDGITHQVWVIADADAITQLQQSFASVPNLYIADGHHRCASAAAVCKKRIASQPDAPEDAPFRFILSVLFPAEELHILDYNRVVKDLNGLSVDDFLQEVTKRFYLMPWRQSSPCHPRMPHQFGMYFENQWYLLTAQEEIIPEDPVGSLDVSILQKNLLGPILGIDDPRTNDRIDFVGGIRGLGELEKRVLLGEAKVAFALYPTSMEELIDVADHNLIMPPKSTWFEPKLRSGLFIHLLQS